MPVTQSASDVALSEPTLPKGGGAMRGLGEAFGPVDSSGVATMLLPLPVSAGRGYAPQLALRYASGSGNGPFGVGWQLGLTSVGRHTARGTPQYGDDDACWPQMIAERLITPQGYIRVKGRLGIPAHFPEPVHQALARAARNPVHAVTLTADRYPNDTEQQVRVAIAYTDGFGRALQGCAKVPGGLA